MKTVLRSVVNRLGFDVVRKRNSNSDLTSHLSNLFSAKNIDCVIDVGANSGQYGKLLRDSGYKGHIVSFEPVRSVYERLQQNAKGDKHWLCYNLALGDIVQEKPINVYKSTVFSSFLEATAYSKDIWNSLESVNTEVVSVARFDDIYRELAERTSCQSMFLKMDTQGYDINVFRGAVGALENVKGIQSELSLLAVYQGMPAAYEVLTEFHRHGFLISGMYPINRDKSLAVIEYDCVLVRADVLPEGRFPEAPR